MKFMHFLLEIEVGLFYFFARLLNIVLMQGLCVMHVVVILEIDRRKELAQYSGKLIVPIDCHK